MLINTTWVKNNDQYGAWFALCTDSYRGSIQHRIDNKSVSYSASVASAEKLHWIYLQHTICGEDILRLTWQDKKSGHNGVPTACTDDGFKNSWCRAGSPQRMAVMQGESSAVRSMIRVVQLYFFEVVGVNNSFPKFKLYCADLVIRRIIAT